MICKNCMKLFDDKLSCCPECGTPIKSDYKPSEENSKDVVDSIVSRVMASFKAAEEEKKRAEAETQALLAQTQPDLSVVDEAPINQEILDEAEEIAVADEEPETEEVVIEQVAEEFSEDFAEEIILELTEENPTEIAEEISAQEQTEPSEINLEDYAQDKTEQEIDQIEEFIAYDEFSVETDSDISEEAKAEQEAADKQEDSEEAEADYYVQQAIDENVIEATIDEADIAAFENFSEEENEDISQQEDTAEEVEEFDGRPEKFEKEKLTVRSEEKEASPREKSAMKGIIALVLALAVFIGAISAVSFFTDFFEEDGSIKTVALSGLSAEETKDFEEYLSKISIVAYEGFDRKSADVGEFLSLFNPSHPGGLYAEFNASAELVVNRRDPARRFANENGDYSYYVIDEEYIDPILKNFGFNVYHGINEKDCYYCDGKYYFRYLNDNIFGAESIAQIEATKRTDDGKYYAECVFYNEQTESSDMDYLKAYIIFEKVDNSWKISTISHEAVFDSTGVMIATDEQLDYEIKSICIENKDESGNVVASCQMEYPYFKGFTKAEIALNQLYETMIASYQADTSAILKDVAVVSRVTYNKNGFVSVTEETTKGTAYINESEKDGKTVQTLRFPKRSIQGYTLNIETGENISKKEILKPEYHTVATVLYCIWSGYDYTAVLSGEEGAIPDDKDEIGIKLYEAASSITQDGYTFHYVDKEARTRSLVIPFDTADMFRFSF